ncbi:hypothetical protein ABT112_13150 [Streptomyces sp. NPDC002055]|uniref:hypothetical protein n=1 Tax=Streptomyces sp. NPDC002055 TaxID=3154534 RepID=UPI00332E6275
MPRGRHRHSPPLHRLLPPTSIAAASVVCAAGAWLIGDAVALRVLVAGTAALGIGCAALTRQWDRVAGKRVAELTAARVRDEWRTDERIAELEIDLEESRELRSGLEGKLRSKRAELARLRNEHAELLRRYATAETERASALEGRRQLALESGEPAKALSADSSDLDANGAPTPSTYLKADRALSELLRNGARQQAQRTVAAARRRDLAERREAEEPTGKHAAAAGTSSRTAATDDTAVEKGRRHKVATASAVAPPAPLRRPAAPGVGGFDFFGTQGLDQAVPAEDRRPGPAAAPAPDEDLADVVGAEAFAEHEANRAEEATAADAEETEAPGALPAAARAEDVDGAGTDRAGADGAGADGARPGAAADTVGESAEGTDGAGNTSGATGESGEVIDLTEYDETEQIDLRRLRRVRTS